MCSRRISTGSSSVSGSTTTMPAGTSTSHRRDSACSERASERGDGEPDDESRSRRATTLAVGEQQRPGRDARGDERAPRAEPVRAAAAAGMRSGKPRLVAVRERVPAACATGADSANAAATIVDATASVALECRCRRDRDDRHHDGARRDDAQQRESPRSRREQGDQTRGPRGPQQHGRDDAPARATSPRARPRARRPLPPASSAQLSTRAPQRRSSALRFPARRRAASVSYESSCPTPARSAEWRPRSAASRIAMPTRPPRSCCGAFPSCRPRRSSRCARRAKGFVAQWAGVVGVDVADDGAIRISGDLDPRASVEVELRRRRARRRLLTFLDASTRCLEPPKHVKVQVTGPLTLGVALVDAGVAPSRALRARRARGSRVGRRRSSDTVADAPARAARSCCSSTSPRWCSGAARHLRSIREFATDLLSTALAAPSCLTGVHVCGRGDLATRARRRPERRALRRRSARPRRRHRALVASSTAAAGWSGVRSRRTVRSASTRSRCGRRCSTCGAS